MTVGSQHITGSREIVSGQLSNTYTRERPRCTVAGMFFKPYESSEEFVSYASHMLLGALGLSLFILAPALMTGICAILLGILLIVSFFESDYGPFLGKDLFGEFINIFADILTAPIALVIVCTRGFSTLLQATGIYDYDYDAAPFPVAP